MSKSYTELSNPHKPQDKLKGLVGVNRWLRTDHD